MEAIHYFNGQYLKKSEISISPNDVGFTRGYAVFEFFKVKGKTPIFWEDHLDRLEKSAAAIGLPIPLSRDELKTAILKLVEINGFDYSSIKVMLSGGVSADGFSPGTPTLLIQNNPFQDFGKELYDQGASLMLHEYQRDFLLVKSTYYVQAVALQQQWKSGGHLDVLYHKEGMVSEVSRSSIFIILNGQLITNKENVLQGVTQRNVIRAVKNDFEVVVREFSLVELLNAEEVFITSTTKKVVPIVKVGDTLIGSGKPGMKTLKILSLFEAYIEGFVSVEA
ncbi:aminotransferase class IV [Roseivirga pacifica]|uniref:aminotransferase class IV n=1 Tax=Roseivirga pacifica TaxID=1267423 RepID=UPI002094A2F7|nr:aminotransferase class IV [Roseivirga pacifica]MCO6358595.1 amino acid aminotransferase [Roseivirga pacifica]MCO6365769.1 amino acid aminotransferase [Roseivirga pacifica]MCO6371501.1 amino acid aminotransferase [Roseivirga pacifica]MCO6376388.1 amino acid aminotransferase [Roseivirga pacifica]MCO6378879.1 amino acid aminotransferase [Roseivirga pacifica]